MSVYCIAQTPLPPPPPEDIGQNEITCFNNVKDGNETDVDCGGICNKCETGMICTTNDDCLDGFCSEDMICTVPNACSNNMIDLGETDVDCGGECNPCINGLNCINDPDCISGFCNSEKVCSVGSPITTTENNTSNTVENNNNENPEKPCSECICNDTEDGETKQSNIFFWLLLIYGIGCTGALIYLFRDKFPTYSKRIQEAAINEPHTTPREEKAQTYVSQYLTLGYSRNSIEVGLRRNKFTQEEINKAFESQTI